MLKFGLLILLANIFLKLLVGIGLWSMAMDFKSGEAINFSEKYDEETFLFSGGNAVDE